MKPTKIMIRCDMEGVSGIVSYDQAEPGKPEYEVGRRLFMSDLKALIQGINEGGAGQIVIYDEHCSGRNVDLEQIPANVSVICGKPPYRPTWPGGLDDSFDGVVLLGFHSKAGTPHGLLRHTYEHDIRDLRVNGLEVGEIGMEAAVAGDVSVPVILVIGDSAGVREAEALLPGVRGVSVKQALSESGACCWSSELTATMIRKAAAEVVDNPPDVAPLTLDKPVTLWVELNDGSYLEAVKRLYPGQMNGERTVSLTADSATAAWARYWQMKLAAQAAAEGTATR